MNPLDAFHIMFLTFSNTLRCDMEEVKDEEESTMNEGEAAVSIAHAKLLVESGVNASDIGIITPYAAQVFGPLDSLCIFKIIANFTSHALMPAAHDLLVNNRALYFLYCRHDSLCICLHSFECRRKKIGLENMSTFSCN
jgi:hypothetical protein